MQTGQQQGNVSSSHEADNCPGFWPVGLLTQRPGVPVAEDCRDGARRCLGAGFRLIVPAIVNYEIRRELLRAGKRDGLARLERFITRAPDRYLPLTDAALQQAAVLWA